MTPEPKVSNTSKASSKSKKTSTTSFVAPNKNAPGQPGMFENLSNILDRKNALPQVTQKSNDDLLSCGIIDLSNKEDSIQKKVIKN